MKPYLREPTRRLWLISISYAALSAVSCAGGQDEVSGKSCVFQQPSVVVETFAAIDSAPSWWPPAGFAESLTVRLARAGSVRARVANHDDTGLSDFSLVGGVTIRDRRLVVSARLEQQRDKVTVWNATFWRSDASTGTLVDDIAAAVVEALNSEIAKQRSRRDR